MIGLLKGVVFSKKLNSLILLISDIGYLIFVPQTFLSKIKLQQKLTLYIHTHIREDAQTLFGFEKEEELNLFEMLLTVSGIGPKTAMLIIDRGVENIITAIKRADVSFFTSIPRLGTKNSQKVIIELKNKLGGIADLDLQATDGETKEVVEAMLGLGFKKDEIISALKKIPHNKTSVEEKIKFLLKNMGKK